MIRTSRRPCGLGLRRIVLLVGFFVGAAAGPRCIAQLPDVTVSQRSVPQTPTDSPSTMFPHRAEGRFWISGQLNVIFQANAPFHAEYSGPHSFQSKHNQATGEVATLYTGVQLAHWTEVLGDAELTNGLGLSGVLGIAGFPNLDAVRDPALTPAPYMARLMFHQVLALSHLHNEAARGPLSTFAELPDRRIEIRFGKLAVTDSFDTNSVGGDSHLQFLNWAIDQNGAYDFTADARGYTWGLLGEYQSPRWGLRSLLALMEGPQNGGPLIWNLRRANTSDTEFELHRGPFGKAGITRLLGWVNHGNMGVYQYAIDQYLAGVTPVPDISHHPQQVTAKYGFGVNFEQALSPTVTAYGRFGWNNGETETWSFTEVDQAVSGGVTILGYAWKRRGDRAGIAGASNAISSVHARYLALGGLGSVLGDGTLDYGRENLIEAFYTARVWRGVFLAPDLQFIVHPGYNQARGPVFVPAARMHVEF
jgi:high affinity Mn2+ porin